LDLPGSADGEDAFSFDRDSLDYGEVLPLMRIRSAGACACESPIAGADSRNINARADTSSVPDKFFIPFLLSFQMTAAPQNKAQSLKKALLYY